MPAADPPEPPEDRVAYDRPCARCGYNLFGLGKADLCPECALPVLESIGGKLFFRGSARYLRRLDLAAVMIEVLTVSLWLTVCIPPLALLLACLAALAWLLLASPPPDRAGSLEIARAGRRVRMWAIASILAALVAGRTTLDIVGIAPPQGALGFWYVRLPLLALAAVALGGLASAGCRLTAELALRLSDPRLARAARRLVVPSLAVGPGLVAIPALLGDAPTRGVHIVWAGPLVALALAGWVAITLLVTLTTRLRAALWDEVRMLPPKQPPGG